MTKPEIVNQLHTLLGSWGLTGDHYIISWQGPTVIFSMNGMEKITNLQIQLIKSLGAEVLG